MHGSVVHLFLLHFEVSNRIKTFIPLTTLSTCLFRLNHSPLEGYFDERQNNYFGEKIIQFTLVTQVLLAQGYATCLESYALNLLMCAEYHMENESPYMVIMCKYFECKWVFPNSLKHFSSTMPNTIIHLAQVRIKKWHFFAARAWFQSI